MMLLLNDSFCVSDGGACRATSLLQRAIDGEGDLLLGKGEANASGTRACSACANRDLATITSIT